MTIILLTKVKYVPFSLLTKYTNIVMTVILNLPTLPLHVTTNNRTTAFHLPSCGLISKASLVYIFKAVALTLHTIHSQ